MADEVIRVESLDKDYDTPAGPFAALKAVDLVIRAGEFVAIMGPSGSGKSTLVAALSGLLKPDEGQVTGMGEDLWGLKPAKLDRFRLDHCGFIFQGFNLFSALTALQQVEIILKYKGVPKRLAREKAAHALTEVGLEHKLHQRPSELSGGEKQRVAIARALAKDPQLIFADEPTSALDSENGQVVIKLLHRAAKQHGAAVICVTHDPRLETYADRVIHLEDGRILDDRRTEHAANVSGAAHLKPALIGA